MDVVFTVAAITYQVELYEYHGMCVFTWGTTLCHVIIMYSMEVYVSLYGQPHLF